MLNNRVFLTKKMLSIMLLVILAWSVFPVSDADAAYLPQTTLDTKYSTPSAARPDYLSPITDSTFGTTITRVSDQTAFDRTNAALRHAYAKKPVWNSDESYLLLGYSWPAQLLDGKTYKLIKYVSAPSGTWANSDPNIIYGTMGGFQDYGFNKFVSLDVRTNQLTVLHEFSEYDSVTFGEGEGNLSNDDRYAVIQAKSGTTNYIVVYDIKNDEIISTLNTGTTKANNASVSQSGNYVVVQWGVNGSARNQGIEVFSLNMAFQRQIHTTGLAHFDIGYDVWGNEVIAYYYDSGSNMPRPYMVRLDNGAGTDLLGSTPGRIGWNWHVSCRNTQRPGWCYYSDYSGSGTTYLAQDEVYAIKLDGSGTVERFAQVHHTYNASAYASMPMAVPDRDGDRVLFASEWGEDPITGTVYAYVAEKDTNLVQNGGFENGTTGWNDWGNAVVGTENPYFGTNSLKIGTADGSGKYQDMTTGFAVGQTFQLSGVGRLNKLLGGMEARIGVKMLDGAGAELMDVYQIYHTDQYAAKNLTFTVPANTAKIRVYASTKVTLNQGVYFYADEIKLTEAENVLKNGSFENGMTNWGNWGKAVPTPYNPFKGRKSLRVEGGSTSGSGIYQDVTSGFSAGDKFVFSGWAKMSKPTTGTKIALGVEGMDSSGAILFNKASYFYDTNYNNFSTLFEVPANTARIRVYVYGHTTSPSGLYMYVDDLTLVKQ